VEASQLLVYSLAGTTEATLTLSVYPRLGSDDVRLCCAGAGRVLPRSRRAASYKIEEGYKQKVLPYEATTSPRGVQPGRTTLPSVAPHCASGSSERQLFHFHSIASFGGVQAIGACLVLHLRPPRQIMDAPIFWRKIRSPLFCQLVGAKSGVVTNFLAWLL
jgi:hypothetical protein